MATHTKRIDRTTERAIRDILRSKAQTRIYLFLLRTTGARSEEIIKGTHLHPSTVRELLSKMHDKRLIYREKMKNESIGKNPYVYRPIPPIKLLQRYAQEIEDKLNRIAKLTANTQSDENNHLVKINIYEEGR